MFFEIFNNFLSNLSSLLRKKSFSYFIFAISLIFSIVTYLNFSEHQLMNARYAFTILYIDAALVLLVVCIVGYRVFDIIYSNKNSQAGSSFQIKLISIFGILVFVPSFIMTVFAIIFFHGGMDSWFTDKNETVLNESLKVAESYLKEHQKVIANDALSLAQMLELKLPILPRYEDIHDNFLNTLIQMKSLEDAILFDDEQNVIARSDYSYSLEFILVKTEDLELAKKKGVVLIDTSDNQYVVALACLDIYDTGILSNDFKEEKTKDVITKPVIRHAFLLVRRHIDKNVIDYIEKTKTAVSDYNSIQERRINIEASFAFIFFLIAMLLVLSAIGIAINLGEKIIRPIGELIDAANKIKVGNYKVRVKEDSKSDDEIMVLQKTFNEMVGKIKTQHSSLKKINKDLDNRIQFIENVLYGVSSGVVGVNNSRKIYIFNKFAGKLFNFKKDADISDFIPNISPLLDDAIKNKEQIITQSIVIKKINGNRVLSLKAVFVNKLNGFIITFEDLTELTAVQKKAAWSDVARKIAHEIKNPLTPIQLSIERILRKFEPEVKDKQQLRDITNTIVSQVGVIKRLINDFSTFSKMPDPVLNKHSIEDILNNVVLLQKTANQDIDFIINNEVDDTIVLCDDNLITQALMNIIKNSVNAIHFEKEERSSVESSENKRYVINIELSYYENFLKILINDNGPGFPEEYIDKITDPYFSFIPNGTGLGLAIVQKIINDHSAKITFKNRTDMKGASVEILLKKEI